MFPECTAGLQHILGLISQSAYYLRSPRYIASSRYHSWFQIHSACGCYWTWYARFMSSIYCYAVKRRWVYIQTKASGYLACQIVDYLHKEYVQPRYLKVTVQEKLRSGWAGPFVKVEGCRD
jgi:hypothetical protein